MKPSVIAEMSTGEIKERIGGETSTLIKLKLNHAVSPLENPMKIKFTRKTIARLLTELRKRELAETSSHQPETRSQKQETRNQKQETSSKPEKQQDNQLKK